MENLRIILRMCSLCVRREGPGDEANHTRTNTVTPLDHRQCLNELKNRSYAAKNIVTMENIVMMF